MSSELMRQRIAIARAPSAKAKASAAPRRIRGTCLCGVVVIEIVYPAFWAWHDHSAASRKAHGAAYATYVGCWKKNVRVARGRDSISTFEDRRANTLRSFCAKCGAPLFYERRGASKMIDIPRALFSGRTGREPRYHLNIGERADWIYEGGPLSPLKNFPGVMWSRPRSRKQASPAISPDRKLS